MWGYAAMAVVFTLPHHITIVEWNMVMVSIAATCCIVACGICSIRFRKRMQTMAAFSIALFLLTWMPGYSMYMLGVTNCLWILLTTTAACAVGRALRPFWHPMAILLLCNPAGAMVCWPLIQTLPILFAIKLCLYGSLCFLALCILTTLYHL